MRNITFIISIIISVIIMGCDLDCDPSVENCLGCPNNNSFDCAKNIQLGDRITDRINIANEEYYFVVDFNRIGVLEIEIPEVPDGIYMYVEVYETNNNNSRVMRSGSDSGQSIVMDAGSLSVGKHYIKVSASGGDTSEDSYTMTVRLNTDDKNELNDSFADAKLIDLDGSLTASIRSSGDVDYYKFVNNTVGVVDINIPEVPDGIYMFAEVYETNNDNSRVVRVGANSGQSIVLSAGPFDKGEHYIKIFASSDGSSADTYQMNTSWDDSDIYELNNSFAQASEIELGTPVEATIRAAGDVDFYKFDMASAGIITITVPKVPEDVYMFIDIFETNNDNSRLNRGSAAGGQSINFVSNKVLDAGTHYLKVWASSDGHSAVPYTLTIKD